MGETLTAWERRLRRLGSLTRGMKEEGRYFYEPIIERHEDPYVWVNGRKMLMLASYSYLGLGGHPSLRSAAEAAWGEFGSGTHGTRITMGTTRAHTELEGLLARFFGTEAAVVVGSGLVANTSVIQCLAGKEDLIFFDRLNHASLHDGCRISGAGLREFSHEDLGRLDEMLGEVCEGVKYVIVDGVFSMDGDVLDLPALLAITRRHGAVVMVDEAHSFGVLGKTGRGITEHFGLGAGAVEILMGVLSKAIPSAGGFICGSRGLIDALKGTNHGFIFSGGLPAHVVASASAAIEVLEAEPERVEKIRRNVGRYVAGLRKAGVELGKAGESAVVPILFRNMDQVLEVTRICFERGVLVTPVMYPAVPINAPRVRTTMTASLSDEEVDRAVEVVGGAVRVTG